MMARDTQLYEVCPACGGSGVLKGPISVVRGGVTRMHPSYPCPACESRRVVAIGITGGQLQRLVSQELAAKGGESGFTQRRQEDAKTQAVKTEPSIGR